MKDAGKVTAAGVGNTLIIYSQAQQRERRDAGVGEVGASASCSTTEIAFEGARKRAVADDRSDGRPCIEDTKKNRGGMGMRLFFDH
jgi:hypothetical protein